MRKLRPGRILLGLVGLAVGIAGVLALREATLSTHQEVTGTGTELIVSAKTKGGEKSQRLPEMVEAQVLTCRLEVTADVDDGIERLDSKHFRAVLDRPLDHTNRRQFRGCVEDFMVDHLQMDVVELQVIP
ncbi:MAG: hypothetical protein ACRDY4_08485 [Acidimicrobiia bacterium]